MERVGMTVALIDDEALARPAAPAEGRVHHRGERAHGAERARPSEPLLDAFAERGDQALVTALVTAIGLHAAAAAAPLSSLGPMRDEVAAMQRELATYFRLEYDVAVDRTPPPAEPPPEPEPAPEPEPVRPALAATAPPARVADAPVPAPPPSEPYPDEPPPAPAEAPDVLTREGGEDLSGWGMVDHDGSRVTGGGYTSAAGTAKSAVHDPSARVGGTPGARGNGEPQAPLPRASQARPARYLGGGRWSCPFPPEADVEQIDRAVALVRVTVGADGRATNVAIVSDPGHGFGRQARRCAMAQRYEPARDADGRAIASTLPPIRVTFDR
jgi:protein TonB